eukprot:scaffold2613_cov63-Cyclotella_meneghiniana.AAC.1
MPFAPTVIKSAASSAQTVLQRRAIQCSFSSVFHIRDANGGKITQESRTAERIFTRAVAWPLCVMGLFGGGACFKREVIDRR